MCMNYFLCKQKQRKLHPHLWKCYHFSLSTIDNFELKDYFITIICQIVSWYCSFKRPEFQILIKIMDRVFQKNISQIWKLLEKLKNCIFFSLVAIYTPSPVFKDRLYYALTKTLDSRPTVYASRCSLRAYFIPREVFHLFINCQRCLIIYRHLVGI
jgi:hypothetical protein